MVDVLAAGSNTFSLSVKPQHKKNKYTSVISKYQTLIERFNQENCHIHRTPPYSIPSVFPKSCPSARVRQPRCFSSAHTAFCHK